MGTYSYRFGLEVTEIASYIQNTCSLVKVQARDKFHNPFQSSHDTPPISWERLHLGFNVMQLVGWFMCQLYCIQSNLWLLDSVCLAGLWVMGGLWPDSDLLCIVWSLSYLFFSFSLEKCYMAGNTQGVNTRFTRRPVEYLIQMWKIQTQNRPQGRVLLGQWGKNERSKVGVAKLFATPTIEI